MTTNDEQSTTKAQLDPEHERPQTVADGDLRTLIQDLVQNHPHVCDAGPLLSQCVTNWSGQDPSALSQDTFRMMLRFIVLMFTRATLHVERRLAEADRCSVGIASNLPEDLVRDGWIERIERLLKLLTDTLSAQARCAHVATISKRKAKKESCSDERAKRPRVVRAVAAD